MGEGIDYQEKQRYTTTFIWRSWPRWFAPAEWINIRRVAESNRHSLAKVHVIRGRGWGRVPYFLTIRVESISEAENRRIVLDFLKSFPGLRLADDTNHETPELPAGKPLC